jgi:hypothetical protein
VFLLISNIARCLVAFGDAFVERCKHDVRQEVSESNTWDREGKELRGKWRKLCKAELLYF